MGSDAAAAIELAAVDSYSIWLRGSFPGAPPLGKRQRFGPDTCSHTHLGLLYWWVTKYRCYEKKKQKLSFVISWSVDFD